MRSAELCAGYGGLALAIEEVFGSTTAWFSEFEDAPSRILAHHYPHVPNHGDMTKIDWSAVEPVDIIGAGYPCQPFSGAGRRLGQSDPRHLWPTIVGAIDALRPKLCVFENVRGHLSLGFDDVIRDLDILGYDVIWRVNRAADIGAPHGRARIFILAEDRNAPLRSWFDRRRRVHRDTGVGRLIPGAAQSRDDRQGITRAGSDGLRLRREGVRRQEGNRNEQGRSPLGVDRHGGGGSNSSSETVLAGQNGTRRGGTQLSANDRERGEVVEWSNSLDRSDEGQGAVLQDSDPRGEPPWAGPHASTNAQRDPVCEAQSGHMVGAGGFAVWPGAFHWEVSDIGVHAQWRGLRAADVGAPHGRFRVFVLAELADADHQGSQGQRDSDGASQAQRHGHASAGTDDGTADPTGNGWDQGRAESTRLEGRHDAPLSSDPTIADAISEHRGQRREPGSSEAQGGRASAVYSGRGGTSTATNTQGGRCGVRQSNDEWAPRGTLNTPRDDSPTASGSPRTPPTTADTYSAGGEARSGRPWAGNSRRSEPLEHSRTDTEWGAYEPAIRRWESAMGRRAPAPTEPTGRNGNHRLSARFAEWMMGVPDGWIVDVPGVSRNEALKAAGNGVVPQQAIAALRDMLATRESLEVA